MNHDFEIHEFLYVEKHSRRQTEDLYLHMTRKRCELEGKTLQNAWPQAVKDPVEFAYDYTGGPGYTAIVRGEVIYLVKCQAVEVMMRPAILPFL